jgi:hypothetical protein
MFINSIPSSSEYIAKKIAVTSFLFAVARRNSRPHLVCFASLQNMTPVSTSIKKRGEVRFYVAHNFCFSRTQSKVAGPDSSLHSSV